MKHIKPFNENFDELSKKITQSTKHSGYTVHIPEEAKKKDLLSADYSSWESDEIWKQAFEIAKSNGSCKIPGDSFMNVFRPLEDKLLNLYIYEGDLYSITPITQDRDYGGYGPHLVKLVDKSAILTKLNNLIEKLS